MDYVNKPSTWPDCAVLSVAALLVAAGMVLVVSTAKQK